jgi:hypothetical protein
MDARRAVRPPAHAQRQADDSHLEGVTFEDPHGDGVRVSCDDDGPQGHVRPVVDPDLVSRSGVELRVAGSGTSRQRAAGDQVVVELVRVEREVGHARWFTLGPAALRPTVSRWGHQMWPEGTLVLAPTCS